MLHDKGFGVAVFEKEATIGGMCQSVETKYGTVDTVGFHVFNTNRKEVRDWVFSVYPEKNWRFNERNAKVWMTLRYYSYPIERNFDLSPSLTDPINYREWLLSKFGEQLCERYFFPYNEKVWRVPLTDMGFSWCTKRMPVDGGDTIHKGFYYPREGGIQSLINAIAAPIEHCIVRNADVKISELVADYRLCIVTAPLPEVLEDVTDSVKEAVGRLKYNSHAAVYKEERRMSAVSWIYYPSGGVDYYKKSYVGNFDGSDRDLVCLDYINRDVGFVSKYAYPIQTLELPHLMRIIRRWASDNHVILLGRFAEWEYFTMDDCIHRAMEVSNGMERSLESV